jgi:hypothetical protein
MKLKKSLILLLSLVIAVYSVSALAKDQEWPEVTEDGLHRVHDSKMAIVYVEPGADLAPYSRVIILEPTVAFKKNWARDQRSRSASKLSTSARVNTKRIKKDLAEEFETVFTDALNGGGYEVTTEAADDVLLIRPSIVDLDITAPETHGSGRSNTYTRSAGEMTLYIELFDSVTGDLIAKALDRQIDNPNDAGFYTYANSQTNKAASVRILKGWADILLNALNEARSYPLAAEPDSED